MERKEGVEMVYHGWVKNGAIVLDAGADLPDGAEVRIELELLDQAERGGDPLLRMMDLAIETGVSDLATNVDHYLYGHPKAGDAK
jgi:hypothetical protein